MKAIHAIRFGGPENLQVAEVPDPDTGSGQVLIDVRTAEVIFLDTQLRAGWAQDFFPVEPPFVPGTGVGGTVGERRVIARTGQTGGYAERVAADPADVYDVPAGLDLDLALAALHDGPTALSRLDTAAIRDGERVLVTAAAGSLGAWLIPLAKAAGATVVAAARGARKLDQARELGADEAIDYSDPDWPAPARRAAGDRGFEVVFDGAGGDVGTAAVGLTEDGGRFFSYGAASGAFADAGAAQARRITVVGIGDQLSAERWRELTLRALDLLTSGAIRPVIGNRLPLERAADAHTAMADRTVIGKTVLVVGAP
jgi:NADPH2:quinone reductase